MVRELAKMIDHSLLHPTLTDEDLRQGCELAIAYDVASVCIKPYAVKQAVALLKDSNVLVGTVIGFPHGNSSIEIKVAETVKACEDGAVEIDMVVNIGKVLSEDWDYIDKEIGAIVDKTNEHKACLKVIFENDFLQEDKHKIKLCEICSKHKVGFVKTSTGYGMVKGADGKYGYKGATEHDLKLMREHSDKDVEVKAAGGVRTVDDMLKVKALGVSRIGASATKAMLDAAAAKFGEEKVSFNSGESEGY